jgi:hypothetical protein
LILNDNERFPDELAAFRTAFQGRRFGVLLTDGILAEYQIEANKFPPFSLQPSLDTLFGQGRAVRVDEFQLNRSDIQLTGLPQEHREFILDAIAAGASYVITNRQEWLNLSEQTNRHGLQIVNPRSFVELEG